MGGGGKGGKGLPLSVYSNFPPDISNVYQELQGRIKNFLKGGGVQVLAEGKRPWAWTGVKFAPYDEQRKVKFDGKKKSSKGAVIPSAPLLDLPLNH